MAEAVPFSSPASLRETVTLPHAGKVTGMAIRPGVTVIVGGGYHGKSTLLAALERAVYPHVPGDGRQLVATLADACKVRAEDGRCVTGVDISLFINGLPGGADTRRFSTLNASGSTSQAAAIAEALEMDTPLLLIDEDTSATNLMIRDQRMRQLVAAEPITPLVDRVRELYRRGGVSTIVVMGGSGDYLDAADLVLGLDTYVTSDVTEEARRVCAELPRRGGAAAPGSGLRGNDTGGSSMGEDEGEDGRRASRLVRPRAGKTSPTGTQGQRPKTKSRGRERISLDRTDVDLSAVAQVVDQGQTEAIAWALRALVDGELDKYPTVSAAVRALLAPVADGDIDALAPGRFPAFLAAPRAVDVAAALNRYRPLQLRD